MGDSLYTSLYTALCTRMYIGSFREGTVAMVTLKSRAYDHIREGLLTGNWPASLVLSPNKVAKRIGMSYTPVREAFRQLETEGLVERVANLGVRPKRLDRQGIEELFEMRMVLEGGAAKIAAEKISEQELDHLTDLLARQRGMIRDFGRMLDSPNKRIDRPIVWQDLPGREIHMGIAKINFEFHSATMAAACNQRVMKTAGDLRVLTSLLRGHVLLPGETMMAQQAKAYQFHMRILGALKRHDGNAARDWSDMHIQSARHHHLAVHDWQQQLAITGRDVSVDWPDDLLASLDKIQEDIRGTQEARE